MSATKYHRLTVGCGQFILTGGIRHQYRGLQCLLKLHQRLASSAGSITNHLVQSCTQNWSSPLSFYNVKSYCSMSTRREKASALNINIQRDCVEIKWSDQTTSRYHNLWLRKNCHCPLCRLVNGQVIMLSSSLPSVLTHKETKLQSDDSVVFTWNEVDHDTTFSLQWLRDNSYSRKALQEASDKQDVSVFKGPIREFTLKDLQPVQELENEFLKVLNSDGVVLVKGIPCQQGQVIKVAEILAPVVDTLYGKSFIVEATDTVDAINVAYTSMGLEPHMDLTYYQSPPGLQLLHCIRFDENVVGGDTILLDSIHPALEMQKSYSDLFATLVRVPATFQKIHFKRKVPAAYVYRRPHISVNAEGKIRSVIWSPPFEGPLQVPEEDVEPYYKAYMKFAEIINTSQFKVQTRLVPGDCIIFNNLRILHARNEFVLNGGKRILEGCYVNIDDFKSRVQIAHIKEKSGKLAKRVNNGDHS